MASDRTFLELLGYLKERAYEFVAVTPATHALVVARTPSTLPTLRDIFGWNRTFKKERVEPKLFEIMQAADILKSGKDGYRSAWRVASLGEDLFLHSAYPTDDENAVFFGPDTYRFARFVTAHLATISPREVFDLGSGSGAGGIVVAKLVPSASVTLVDTNSAAVPLARVNALSAGVVVDLVVANSVPAPADLIIANPPYMADPAGRAYRDGGGLLGGEISVEWTRDALAKLVPGGTLLLYTGAAFVAGACPLIEALRQVCSEAGASLSIEELDPDVFGEELAKPGYEEVERLAAIGAVIRAAS